MDRLSFINIFLAIIYVFLAIFSQKIFNYFVIILILLIGMPHGAFDFYILKKNLLVKKDFISIVAYLFLPFLAYMLWFFLPSIFWPLFFICSFTHFYQVEMEGRPKEAMPSIAFFSVYCLPFIYQSEWLIYMKELNGSDWASFLINIKYYVITTFFIILFRRIFKNQLSFVYFIYSILFFITVLFTNLIASFMFFFIFIHSKKHLLANKLLSLKRYITIVLPISFLFVFGSFYLSSYSVPILSVVLCLAFITFPHFYLDLKRD